MSGLTVDITQNTIKSGTGGIKLEPTSNEVVTIYEGVLLPDGTKDLPSIRFSDDTNTGIFSPNNDVVSIVTHGEECLRVSGSANAVNYVEISSADVNQSPRITPAGSDTNVDLVLAGKGTGAVRTSSAEVQFEVPQAGKVFVNGYTVLVDEDNVSRMTNDAGYITSADLSGYSVVGHTHVKADITDFSDADYATAAQGLLADSALQDITGESIKDLSDVASAMLPAEGQVLTYQSGEWTSADATGGGSVDIFHEEQFRPIYVGRFGKNGTSVIPNGSAFAVWNTTAYAPINDTVVNVHSPSDGAPSSRLTFFRIKDGLKTVLSSEKTTVIGGYAVWADISGTGDRVAIAVRVNGGADKIIILSSVDDFESYAVEQTITIQDSDAVLTNVMFNTAGTMLYVATGNQGQSGTVNPSIVTYTRSGTTWSTGETIYQAGAGSAYNLLLMHGQQASDVVGFQQLVVDSPFNASLHVYQNSSGWSQVWTKAQTDIGEGNSEANILACISADGNTVFYRTGGTTASIDVGVLTSPSTISTFENLAGSDAPFVLTPDGLNVAYVTATENGGRIWFHHINGTSMDELGFGSFNYEINRPYGPQQHYMKPAKTGHYYMVGNNSGMYTDDAIFAAVPGGKYAAPSDDVIY